MAQAAEDQTSSDEQTKNNWLTKLNKLSALKQFSLLFGAALSCALGLTLVLWLKDEPYQPLSISLSAQNMAQASAILSNERISFKVDPLSGNFLIKSKDLSRAHLLIAAANLGAEDVQSGFELLDNNSGLGVSSFVETTNYKRGLEGELARTIASINNIKSARVHLALPKAAVFVRDELKPSASVLVELHPGQSLSNQQVTAIVNLVATSVPNLQAEQVTVADQLGRLLNANEPSSLTTEAAKQLEYRLKLENMLLNRANNILRPVLGEQHYAVQVNAELDFSVSEFTNETYQPNPVLRSEQSEKEQNQANEAQGVPGALSNQPPLPAEAPEQATNSANNAKQEGNQREQFTRNYEVGREINHTKADTAVLKRLSLGVVIDAPNDESKPDFTALTNALKDAVGFDNKRGDSFTVITHPFAVPAELSSNELPWYLQPQILQLGKIGLIGLFLLLALVLVIRPISYAFRKEPEAPLIEAEENKDPLPLDPSATYSDKLNALKNLANNDSPRVAAALKQWLG